MSEGFDLARVVSTPTHLRLRPEYVGVQRKYQIGELGFSSKSAAADYYKAMRNDFAWQGDITAEPAFGDLKALLAMHPTYGKEAPVAFRVQRSAEHEYKSFCIAFVRADGSWETFSIPGCLTPANPLKDANEACRQVVAVDIRTGLDSLFEREAREDGKVKCDLCETRVTRAEVHADHAAPLTFEVLFGDFIEARCIDLASFTHKPPGSMDGPQIRDPSMRDAFVKYHHSRANLRPLCERCNLKAGHLFRINNKDRRIILPGGDI